MILVMAVIFAFSAMPGEESAQTSFRILKVLAAWIEDMSDANVTSALAQNLHIIIRKVAHFSEYFLLGVTTYYAFKDRFLYDRKWFYITIISICVLFAASDEIHQHYVPGRYGTPTDVLIDSAGALTGIAICLLFAHRRKHEKI